MDAADVVAAKRFVLVDDQEVPRATLSIGSRGLVGLTFLDEAGEDAMVTVGVSRENGSPFVMVQRSTSDGREAGAMMSITEEGRAAIQLQDADGRTRTLLTSN